MSRGFTPTGYPVGLLVSYQINRQLSGWNLPPLVIRAFGAHGQKRRLWPQVDYSYPPSTADMQTNARVCRYGSNRRPEQVQQSADNRAPRVLIWLAQTHFHRVRARTVPSLPGPRPLEQVSRLSRLEAAIGASLNGVAADEARSDGHDVLQTALWEMLSRA